VLAGVVALLGRAARVAVQIRKVTAADVVTTLAGTTGNDSANGTPQI